jgi:diacylglycerol kinase (ATP)
VKSFFESRIRSFGYAFSGWLYVFRTQHNAWIHGGIALLVLVVGTWVNLPTGDWAVIVLTAALVFVAEFVNTSIEAVVDLASPAQHPLAKIAKDVGAAAVLISAIAAIAVGVLILGPPLWEKYIALQSA